MVKRLTLLLLLTLIGCHVYININVRTTSKTKIFGVGNKITLSIDTTENDTDNVKRKDTVKANTGKDEDF